MTLRNVPRQRFARWQMGLLLAGLLTSVPGCGDDGGGATDAADFDGFWLLSSVTMNFGGMSQPTTVVRGETPIGLIGDALFTSSSTTDGTLDFRMAAINDNLMEDDAIEFLGSIEVESDRWILTNENDPGDPMDDSTNVFTTDLDGDVLTLTADPSDPRNTSTDGPTELILTRSTPWGSELQGTWVLTQTGPTDITQCTSPSTGESEYTEASMAMTDRWWTEQESFFFTFLGNETCNAIPSSTEPAWLNGLQWLTEIEGDTLRWYTYDGADMQGSFAEWTFAASGGDYDFTRVDCEPSADANCTGGVTSFTITSVTP